MMPPDECFCALLNLINPFVANLLILHPWKHNQGVSGVFKEYKMGT